MSEWRREVVRGRGRRQEEVKEDERRQEEARERERERRSGRGREREKLPHALDSANASEPEFVSPVRERERGERVGYLLM